jgi:hypothetical protein
VTRLEHFNEAERLADAYKDAIAAAEAMPADTAALADDRHFAAANARALLAKAQVHATLANVPAQVTL